MDAFLGCVLGFLGLVALAVVIMVLAQWIGPLSVLIIVPVVIVICYFLMDPV